MCHFENTLWLCSMATDNPWDTSFFKFHASLNWLLYHAADPQRPHAPFPSPGRWGRAHFSCPVSDWEYMSGWGALREMDSQGIIKRFSPVTVCQGSWKAELQQRPCITTLMLSSKLLKGKDQDTFPRSYLLLEIYCAYSCFPEPVTLKSH